MAPWRRARGPDDTAASAVKRRHERYLLNTRITAIPGTGDPRARVGSRALDLSEGGVGALFRETWQVGVRLDLEVSLPASRTALRVGAIVRHRTGFRYGFEFADLSDEQNRILRDACKFLGSRKVISSTDLG